MSQPTEGTIARLVARACDRGALATAMRNENGAPYASLALTAFDHAGAPLTLISDLAEHTKNIKQDNRASFLFERTGGLPDPLTGPRVTLVGAVHRTDDPRLRARFFRRFPFARRYEAAHDFNLYRMEVKRVHLVAGFGRIHWFGREDYLLDTRDAAALEAEEADILDHMNRDHPAALDEYARKIRPDAGEGWSLIGIDPEGLDLRRGETVLRLDFDEPISDAQSARERLIQLLRPSSSAK